MPCTKIMLTSEIVGMKLMDDDDEVKSQLLDYLPVCHFLNIIWQQYTEIT